MAAQLFERGEDNRVKCLVCAHGCDLAEGATGRCGVRVNHRGNMISLVEDAVTAVNMDPVEKKPLYHFLPGTRTFSIGSAGCNFHCRFCQNHEIARVNPRSTLTGRRLTPETIVRLARENKAPSISFTYNEPTVFFELMYNTAGLAKANGLRTIMVSNGFMSPEFLHSMSKRVDAANIDLKGFGNEFYSRYCGGKLRPVLDNLKRIKDLGWWLEVTTLLIPRVNDSEEETGKIAEFIATELGKETPWHISAFHGAADMINHPSTSLETLERAMKTGVAAGLKHVYLGNVITSSGANTFCPECGVKLIERKGYKTRKMFKGDECPRCAAKIAGVWH
ncbi:MAG: AmmeMemoRadiSam system radical SAM enzyme [Desulfovibrio sp.]|nr:AmmeMemoRadiSam system radical SAM enzyme [Desulfovibrio sp.]